MVKFHVSGTVLLFLIKSLIEWKNFMKISLGNRVQKSVKNTTLTSTLGPLIREKISLDLN